MKRPTKTRADIDTRERVRREPAQSSVSGRAPITARLFGGPLDNRVISLPAGTTEYRVGRWWVYEFAGGNPSHVSLALRPRSRAGRRYRMFAIGQTGRHPAMMESMSKQQPYRKPHNDRSK